MPETISMDLQASKIASVPEPQELKRVLQEVIGSYPKTKAPLVDADFTKDILVEKFRAILQEVNRDSSPGFPLVNLPAHSNLVVLSDPGVSQFVCECAAERLLRLVEFGPSSSVADFKIGLTDPIRLFVKNEPHSKKKIKEGRFRLISSVSFVDSLIERLLFGRQNKAEIENWQLCPSVPGFGFTDEAIKKLQQWVFAQDGCSYDSDMSGWDWSVQEWELRADAERRAQLMDASPLMRKAVFARMRCLSTGLLATTDGKVYELSCAGVMKSGSYCTSSTNSFIRRLASALVGARSSRSMGDDCVENYSQPVSFEAAQHAYALLGHKLKSWSSVKDTFEFCSVRFSRNGWEPLNWAKSLFRFLHQNPPSLERWIMWREQFLFEMRTSPLLPRLRVATLLSCPDSTKLTEIENQSMKGALSFVEYALTKHPDLVKAGGKAAQRALCAYTGYGCEAPPVVSRGPKRAPKPETPVLFPTAVNTVTKQGSRIIPGDEYVAEVNSGTNGANFSQTVYQIQAGNANLFPRLAQQAALYERYRFRKLEFYYAPEVSAFNANGQQGKVMLGVDFDASDAAPATKQQMEALIPHADAMPYQEIRMHVDSKQLGGKGFFQVRTTILPGNSSVNDYDCGSLYVATIGIANNSVKLGELRVRYVCELWQPVNYLSSAGVAYPPICFHIFEAFDSANNMTSGVALLPPLNNYNENDLKIVNNSGVLTLHAGNYLVRFCCQLVCAATTTLTNAQCQLLWNAAVINGCGPNPQFHTSNTFTDMTLNLQGFVIIQASEGDTLQLATTVTFGTSTCSTNHQLQLQSV